MGFKIEVLNPFPPNEDPFWHDIYHMGTQLGDNCIVMYGNHSDVPCKYLIIINTKTGERVKIDFEPDFFGKMNQEIQHELEMFGPLAENEEFCIEFEEGKTFGWRRVIKED